MRTNGHCVRDGDGKEQLQADLDLQRAVEEGLWSFWTKMRRRAMVACIVQLVAGMVLILAIIVGSAVMVLYVMKWALSSVLRPLGSFLGLN